MKDSKGNFHGPLRIWNKKLTYPGLAMTRSIGDAVAHNLGCASHPDVKELKITSADKQIIIASDGVWEKMSNQDVANLVGADP